MLVQIFQTNHSCPSYNYYIQVYLLAVRYSCTTAGDPIPAITPRLHYILKGIRKSCAITHQPTEQRPITFLIMVHLHTLLTKHTSCYRDEMIRGACCLAYFGLLRVSKFTTLSPDHYDSSTDLLLSDIALDNRVSPTIIRIALKQSRPV